MSQSTTSQHFGMIHSLTSSAPKSKPAPLLIAVAVLAAGCTLKWFSLTINSLSRQSLTHSRSLPPTPWLPYREEEKHLGELPLPEVIGQELHAVGAQH